jgi:hypothetical protein
VPGYATGPAPRAAPSSSAPRYSVRAGSTHCRTPPLPLDHLLGWLATWRGLLWELTTGADQMTVEAAAEAFFAHYRGGATDTVGGSR